MTIRAHVKIDCSEPVSAGDILEHALDGTTRPQSDLKVTSRSFARVIDPTSGERSPDGSYRVRCVLLVQRLFVPKSDRVSA